MRFEEALDGIEPRGRGRRIMEREPRMSDEPYFHLGVLVTAAIVEDHVDHLAGRGLGFDGIQKPNELLVTMIPVRIPQIRMPASRRESPTGLFRQICPLDVTIEPATMEHPLLGSLRQGHQPAVGAAHFSFWKQQSGGRSYPAP